MIEIAVIYILCKKNSANALARGRKSGGFSALTVLLWFGMEILGIFIGSVFGLGYFTYVLGLGFAIIGGVISYQIAKNCEPGNYVSPSMMLMNNIAVRANPLATPARIDIVRESSFSGAAASWIYFLNGQNIGSLSNGKTMTIYTNQDQNVLVARSNLGIEIAPFLFGAQNGGFTELHFKVNRFLPEKSTGLLTIESPQPVANDLLCAKCGAGLSKEMQFCRKCGTRTNIQATNTGDAAVPVSQDKVANDLLCANCGASLTKEVQFCRKCGTRTNIQATNTVDAAVPVSQEKSVFLPPIPTEVIASPAATQESGFSMFGKQNSMDAQTTSGEKQETPEMATKRLIYEATGTKHETSEKASNKMMKNASGKKQKTSKNAPKRKFRKTILLLVIVAIIIIGPLCYTFINYYIAMNHAENEQYPDAYSSMKIIPFSNTFFADDYTFIEAGTSMLDGEYDDAILALESLENYDGAAQLISEVKYRKAAMLSDQNSFDEAIIVYQEISEYKDSIALMNDTNFRKASNYIELDDFDNALTILLELKLNLYAAADTKIDELYYEWGGYYIQNGQYLDGYKMYLLADDFENTAQILLDLNGDVYDAAKADYSSGDYEDAKLAFTTLGNYFDSSSYLLLIEAHNATASSFYDSKKLWPLIGFADASDLILSNDTFAKEFLTGTWKSEDETDLFVYETDGDISYNLPWFEYGDCFKIEKGNVILYYEDAPEYIKFLFAITIMNEDSIKILALEDSTVYQLYRQ